MTAGAYSTGLVTYFIHRDLFPALMKVKTLLNSNEFLFLTGLQFVQESENGAQNLEPFILLGLLVNYNKFEFANPYRLRLDDFVNESAIRKLAHSVGAACVLARDKYIAVQDDLPEGWNLSNTLAYVGLGVLAPGSRPATPTLSAEEAKARFNAL